MKTSGIDNIVCQKLTMHRSYIAIAVVMALLIAFVFIRGCSDIYGRTKSYEPDLEGIQGVTALRFPRDTLLLKSLSVFIPGDGKRYLFARLRMSPDGERELLASLPAGSRVYSHDALPRDGSLLYLKNEMDFRPLVDWWDIKNLKDFTAVEYDGIGYEICIFIDQSRPSERIVYLIRW